MPHTLPLPLIEERHRLCENCSCSVDKSEACASCPNKKWGPQLCHAWIDDAKKEQAVQKNTFFPPVKTMATNFISAVSSEAKTRFSQGKRLDPEEAKRRLSICENCVFFHKPSKRCKKCGCFLRWKTSWSSQKCPIGKW
jgi:hypothetical protein